MPLKLNIGLSRKIGEPNYGSRGASINIEAEVDSSLVTDPAKFQERVRQLFGLVRTSLTEELNGNGHNGSTNGNGHGQPTGTGAANGNGNGNGNRGSTQRISATEAQCKALFAITRGQGIDLNQLLRNRFHVGRADDLTIKEASALIDELKKSENRNGG